MRLRVRLGLLALPLALTAPAASGAESEEALAGEAVRAYRNALDTEARDARLDGFRRAAVLFRQLVESLDERGAANADVYTNLGNAALLSEDLGGAVLAYRRALAREPTHPRALQNLGHARTLLPDWVPRPEPAGLWDSFFFWHRSLPRAARVRAGAIAFAAAALLLAAGIRWRQTTLRNAAILPGLAWLALLGSAVLEPGGVDPSLAVVTAEETVARAADSGLAPSAFREPLPGGTEVEVLERRAPWVRVRLANGRDAWVSASSLSAVADDV